MAENIRRCSLARVCWRLFRRAAHEHNAFVRGNPGFGFNEGSNGDCGISRFSAAATDASSF